MADSLVSELKTLLIAELQAKGYSPNPSDVHPAAMKVVALIEKERVLMDAKVKELEDKIASLSKPAAPVTPAPAAPAVGSGGAVGGKAPNP